MGEIFQNFEISPTNLRKIINISYQKFLKADSNDERYKVVSDSQFAYDQISELCSKFILEDQENGKIYMKRVLKFLVGGYRIIGGGIKHNNDSNENMETWMKILELQTYIRENFIKDLLLRIAKHMIGDLAEVRIFNFSSK
jgi:hypothetical protein